MKNMEKHPTVFLSQSKMSRNSNNFLTVSLRNSFTGLVKDYLRELPEALFTKALFEMMVDGLSVCLPDDPAGNAKLMFSILECLPKVERVRKSPTASSMVDWKVTMF